MADNKQRDDITIMRPPAVALEIASTSGHLVQQQKGMATTTIATRKYIKKMKRIFTTKTQPLNNAYIFVFILFPCRDTNQLQCALKALDDVPLSIWPAEIAYAIKKE